MLTALSFILLAFLAAILTPSKAKYIALIYCAGLMAEMGVSALYDAYGLLPGYWSNFYLSMALIDLITLLLMSWCYNQRYGLVYRVMFIMVVVNAIILGEWALFGSVVIQSHSGGMLQALNIIVLLVLLVNSNGNRILDRVLFKLRGRSVEGGFWRSNDLLCLHDPEDYRGTREVKSCNKAS